MNPTLTLKKVMSVGFDAREADAMLKALYRQSPCKMVQERSWFEQEGRKSLAIRTVRAFDTKVALAHIERMIATAADNPRLKLSLWTNLKLCIKKVEKDECNANNPAE